MSNIHALAARALGGARERLGQLHASLGELGRRLRDRIAELVGSHAGEAVREAVLAALPRSGPGPPPRDQRPFAPEDEGHDPYPSMDGAYPDLDHSSYGRAGRPEWGQEHSYRPQPSSSSPEPSPWWRWLVLPVALEMASRWLPSAPRPLVGALGVGAAAALAGLLAGRLAGLVAGAAGAALWLTGLADGLGEAAGRLARLR